MDWRIVSGAGRWSLRSWADGAVLFDEATGSCHALTASTEMVCRLCLQRSHFDAASLANELFDSGANVEDVLALEQVLESFTSIDLIQPTEVIG
jgi:hypothetical protein